MAETELPSDPGARRIIGRLLGAGILGATAIAVVVTLLQWDTSPQTDDATVRANLIGIAPEVSGRIAELRVSDNQKVQEGDLLFLIEQRPYEIALERARATLALTRKEVDSLKNGAASATAGVSRAEAQLNASAAEVTNREMDPVVADAEIVRLEAQHVAADASLRSAGEDFRTADDHLKRLEPLLAKQFVTTDSVEEARTRRTSAAIRVEQARTGVQSAAAALDEAKARKRASVARLASSRAQHVGSQAALLQARSDWSRAENSIGETEGINARVAVAEAAVHSAELDLSHCSVRAPFSGLVVNLNISKGAFARAGTEVFTLVDTRSWYVVANFRETQLRHILSGAAADLYLESQPGRRFRGTVVGLGWAVAPENGKTQQGLPSVDRSLNWIRLAARFPVRIKVENPDDSFRIGASAVATVRSTLRSVVP
jgi:multidrug efflux system membrane fusion protein